MYIYIYIYICIYNAGALQIPVVRLLGGLRAGRADRASTDAGATTDRYSGKAAMAACKATIHAEACDRTRDLHIFSLTLSQLNYRGSL